MTHPAEQPERRPGGAGASSATAFLRDNATWLLAGAATAVSLAGAAVFNWSRSRAAEAETPPAGQFVTVDGVRVHYVERGQGRPLVLLHGNGVTLQDFEASGILDRAAERYRVIAFDRPGFGYTDRPRSTLWTPAAQARLLHGALEQLGAERPIVVGHSWGTMVALAMALDFPRDVAGLVLLSGYYFATVRPDVLNAAPAIPVIGDAMAHTVTPLAARLLGPAMVKASFAPAPVPESFARFPIALALRPSQVRASAADTGLMIPGARALSRRYGELDLPVVIVAGEGDLITHIGTHAEKLVGEIAGSELRAVPGVGHMVHYSAPDQVMGAIHAVAGRIGSAAAPR